MNALIVESLLSVLNILALIWKSLRLRKLFEAALKLSKKLAKKSCMNVDPYFIIDVSNNYELNVDYRNQYLTIERGERWIIFVNNYELNVDYRNQYLTIERGERWIIFVKILRILYVMNLK